MLFDTHAHLFWNTFDEDRDEVMARAREAGVEGILNLGTTPHTSRQCIELAERYPECWAAAGLHPNDIDTLAEDPVPGMAEVEELAGHPKVVAIGETGIDLYRSQDTRDIQMESLRRHFELARRLQLPVVLHNREADRELRGALEEYDQGVTAVLHCFTGDAEFGTWAIDRGHYLGLGGVFTFRSSKLRESVADWDIERLLLETDSPFLSPVPHRGKRNEPAYVLHTAETVAGALDLDPAELARITTENARRLLGLT
jgi:TatD DNase family protein